MALDLNKYRALFLEEAGEHLAAMSQGLLELEKAADSVESIDLIFRMAHSIKSMAASLGYESISEVSHRLEDRMEDIRTAGRLRSGAELTLLFHGLEGLEQMVANVSETGEPPPPRPELIAELSRPVDVAGSCTEGTDPPPPAAVEAPASGPKKKTLK